MCVFGMGGGCGVWCVMVVMCGQVMVVGCTQSDNREEEGQEVVWGSSPTYELGMAQKGILCEAGASNGLWRYCGLRREGGGVAQK